MACATAGRLAAARLGRVDHPLLLPAGSSRAVLLLLCRRSNRGGAGSSLAAPLTLEASSAEAAASWLLV